MSHTRFNRLSRSLFSEAGDQRLFESVWEAIASQVEDKTSDVNLGKLATVPAEAQTVYWLWRFQAEVACGGLEVFVYEWLGMYSPQIHAALKEVRAQELLRRLEAAIPFALGRPSAELSHASNQVWFQQFAPVSEYPTLQSIDKGIYPIVWSLTDAVAAYIRRNEGILFQP
jgi:Domain of unknown function (DUF4375)